MAFGREKVRKNTVFVLTFVSIFISVNYKVTDIESPF